MFARWICAGLTALAVGSFGIGSLGAAPPGKAHAAPTATAEKKGAPGKKEKDASKGAKKDAGAKDKSAPKAAAKPEPAKKDKDASKAADAKKDKTPSRAADAKKDKTPSKADKSEKAEAAKKADKGDKADRTNKADAAKKDKEAPKSATAKKDKDASKADKKSAQATIDGVPAGWKGSASVGAPNHGRLSRGMRLTSSRHLKVKSHAHPFGLPGLVKLLQRSAGRVTKRHPRSVMLVADLSSKNGGPLTGHNSHQTGRDADVGFYVSNSQGKPAYLGRFIAFDGKGKSESVGWAQFDDARNWTLVESLLTDKEVEVRYIFVSAPLRARLLAFAAKKKVAKDLISKAESVLLSPRDADVHDDHFHVRIACPDAMKPFCQDESRPRGGAKPATQPAAAPAHASSAAAPASP